MVRSKKTIVGVVGFAVGNAPYAIGDHTTRIFIYGIEFWLPYRTKLIK